MIFGGKGNNAIIGGTGNDWLYAGGGNNVIYGGSGNDSIFAGKGNDMLFGGSGDGCDLWRPRQQPDRRRLGKRHPAWPAAARLASMAAPETTPSSAAAEPIGSSAAPATTAFIAARETTPPSPAPARTQIYGGSGNDIIAGGYDFQLHYLVQSRPESRSSTPGPCRGKFPCSSRTVRPSPAPAPTWPSGTAAPPTCSSRGTGRTLLYAGRNDKIIGQIRSGVDVVAAITRPTASAIISYTTTSGIVNPSGTLGQTTRCWAASAAT